MCEGRFESEGTYMELDGLLSHRKIIDITPRQTNRVHQEPRVCSPAEVDISPATYLNVHIKLFHVHTNVHHGDPVHANVHHGDPVHANVHHGPCSPCSH